MGLEEDDGTVVKGLRNEPQPSTSTDNVVSKYDIISIPVELNGQNLELELDTGSKYNLMSMGLYIKQFEDVALKETTVQLKSFTEDKCLVVGKITVMAKVGSKLQEREFLVVKNVKSTVLGRSFENSISR